MARSKAEQLPWDPDNIGPAEYLSGHLRGRYIGDPESLRRATHEAIISMFTRSGMSRDEAVDQYDIHFADRPFGISPISKGVLLDFDAGEPDQPYTILKVIDP